MDFTELKIARVKLGLKQYQVAAAVGIAPCRLSEIETGRLEPSPELLAKIEEVLSFDGVNKELDPKKVTAIQALEILQALANRLGREDDLPKEIHDKLPLWHRTLQQNFARVIFAGVKALADQCEEGKYDLRNQAAVTKAKKMMYAVEGDIHLPLI